MKKKLLISLLLAACLLTGLGGNALAAAEYSAVYVTDRAGLLTGNERAQLESMASGIARDYGCAPYIITLEDYRDYGSGDISETAMDIYEELGLGYGREKNGILLLMSMEERDYAMVSYGELSHSAFTDYGQEYMEECFLSRFRENDWAGGFEAYLRACTELLDLEAQGRPYDVGSAPGGFNFLIVLIPLAVASVVCGIFAFQMKSARYKSEARDYLPGNGVNMRIVRDRFTHRTVMRQRINTQKSGGGTSINSRGFSGRSGKF